MSNSGARWNPCTKDAFSSVRKRSHAHECGTPSLYRRRGSTGARTENIYIHVVVLHCKWIAYEFPRQLSGDKAGDLHQVLYITNVINVYCMYTLLCSIYYTYVYMYYTGEKNRCMSCKSTNLRWHCFAKKQNPEDSASQLYVEDGIPFRTESHHWSMFLQWIISRCLDTSWCPFNKGTASNIISL